MKVVFPPALILANPGNYSFTTILTLDRPFYYESIGKFTSAAQQASLGKYGAFQGMLMRLRGSKYGRVARRRLLPVVPTPFQANESGVSPFPLVNLKEPVLPALDPPGKRLLLDFSFQLA